MSIEFLITMSRTYGSNPEYVLAGGGNTSYKDDKYMYVKASGSALSTITEDGFVKMDREALNVIFTKKYSDDFEEREQQVLADMMAARCPGEEAKRPSVEATLHHIIPSALVLHLHPTVVGGLVCSKNAKAVFDKLFADEAIWIDPTMPGYILAIKVYDALKAYEAANGKAPNYIFLENHGVFTGGEDLAEIDAKMTALYAKLNANITAAADTSDCEYDFEAAALLSPAIRAITGKNAVSFVTNTAVKAAVSSAEAFAQVHTTFSPDHMVYCGDKTMFVDSADVDAVKAAIDAYTAENGIAPRIIGVKDLGVYICADSKRETVNAKMLFVDAVKVAYYASFFGGAKPLPADLVYAINNWEVERYRRGVSNKAGKGRLAGKVALITGAAQGFGKGIAEELAAEGACIVAADLNFAGAAGVCDELCAKYGAGMAFPVAANVGDEDEVRKMAYATALEFGGIDMFVSNAGIVRAGGLEDMTLANFELSTKINYTAFFLGTKYVSRIMKIEHKYNPNAMFDIIQVNSKSGLAGSNRNFAYAGGKFGGIGLVQSFALELVGDGIKVNAICPGNFLDGPLWSDPEKGLFVQYLRSGKVPGATTVEEVRTFYEAKVPMKRGVYVHDVAVAIIYCVEQKYETGQAIPVTGGQEMLK